MTHTMRGSIDTLRTAMSGPVIGPADPDYEQAAGSGMLALTGDRP